MLFGKYQFFCRLQNEAILPYFKGSTFRGVFGRALKKVVCALKKEECKDCLLRDRCLYVHVFETSLADRESNNSRLNTPPHPFVIEPPLTTMTHFQEGDSFDFCLVLFGEVNQNLPYFIYAFEQMGKIGIGKRIKGEMGQFTLEKVQSGDQLIYSNSDQKLNMAESFGTISLQDPGDYPKGSFRTSITIITPLRLKFQNRLKAELPFHVLVRAMLRRVSSLYDCYEDGEPPLDYRGLVKKAEEVQIVDSDLAWFDWKRYSSRQDKSMLMGGVIGSITYEGDIGEYMPLVDLCTQFHLGKQTTFGLGMISAEIIE